jgi:hypothetical protein
MKRTKNKEAALAGATSPGGTALSPAADGDTSFIGGGKNTQPTLRKCANCGQVGHIKTNKKSAESTARPSRAQEQMCKHCGNPFLRKVDALMMLAPGFLA